MPKWTDQEIEILKVSYENKLPVSVIAQLIPSKSKRSIISRASARGFTENNYFKPDEVDYIRNHYTGENLKELSKILNRTEQLICRKAKELGLTQMGRKSRNRSVANGKNATEKANKYWNSKTGSEIKRQAEEKKEIRKTRVKKYHTPEYRKKVSDRVKTTWRDPNSAFNSEAFKQMQSDTFMNRRHQLIQENQSFGYSRGRGGTREDLGIYVRSAWEANYARYLNFLKEKGQIYDWKFEPDTYWFEKVKRGVRSYTPDFKVWNSADQYEYHEVKGYMDQKSKTKLDRMSRYYPGETVHVIGKDEYKEIKKWSTLISNWE